MSNMVIEKLGNDERWTHHDRYRNNALFTQWERVLDECEERYTEIDTTSLWKHSVKVLQILKDTTYRRDEMMRFLIAEMERGNANKLQVEAVMAIVLTQLANAKEKEHVDEAHPNDTMCISILNHYYFKNGFFKFLIDKHRRLDKDFDGSSIVIPPHDPMMQGNTYDDLPETTQQDVEVTIQHTELESEEERVKQAIISMFEKTYKGGDKPIFSEQYQWRAIYHVLKEKELVDKTQCEFAEWINSFVDENLVPCTEHSLRKRKGIYYDNEKSCWFSEESGKNGETMCKLLNHMNTAFRKELKNLGL